MPTNADVVPPHAHAGAGAERPPAAPAQALLAAIVESSVDAIIGKDLRGVVTSWNGGAERMFGYPASAMIGQPIATLIPADRQCEEEQILARIARGERVEHFETVRQHQDGTLIDVSITISPICDAHGQIVGASKIVRDITAHRRAEEQLRAQADLLNQVSDAIIATDSELIITSWNQAAEQLYGWPAAEAIGQPMHAIVPTDYGEQDRSQVLATLHSHGRWQGQVRQRHRDGTLRTIFSSVSLRTDRAGQTVGTVGVNRDITASIQATAALRASETLTRTILDALPAHIALLDEAGVIVAINRSWEHFARTNGDPTLVHTGIGADYLAICQAATGPNSAEALPAYQGLRSVLAGERDSFALEYPCHAPAEERWFRLRVTPRAGVRQGVVVSHEPITAEKRALRTLRDNERRYRAIFEQAATGIARVAPDGHFLEINERLCAITGYSRATLLGKTFQEITYPDDLATDLAHMRQLLAGAIDTYTLEKRYVRADTTLVWITLTVSLVRAPGGAPDYFVALVEEIAARKQAEAALRASEETLHIVTEAAGLGLALVDADHRYRYSNQTHRNFLGQGEGELAGQHVAEVLDAQYEPEIRQRLERAFAGEVVSATIDLPLASGAGVRHCEVRLARGMFRAEPIVVIVMIDITERKQAEAALRQSETRFAIAFHTSPAAMLMSSVRDGRMIDVNMSYQRLFGYTRDDLLGQTGAAMTIYTSAEQRADIVRLLGQHGSLYDQELVLRAKSGDLRTVLCSLEAIELDGEACLLGSMVDITDRVRAERAIERAAERLRNLRAIDRAILLANAPATIADTVLAHLRRLIPFEQAGVVHYDPTMTVGTQLARIPDQPPMSAVGTRMPLDMAAHPAAFHRGEIVVINDFDAASLIARWPQVSGARALLLAPLHAQGALVGSLTLHSPNPDVFTAEHVEIVHEAGDTLAIALANARLLGHEQRARRVAELLHTAGQLLARPLAIDDILETLLDVLQQLIAYDSAAILLPDPAEPGVFRARHLRGYERWIDPALVLDMPFDQHSAPLIAAIATGRRSRLIVDTRQEPDWRRTLAGEHISCWLGVPLIAGDEVVGIYSIDRITAHTLTLDDMRLGETLAATAATAIARAQLLNQLRDERAQLVERVGEQTAELRVANAELARAARLKDEFLASMSHELRTPLNAILGRSEALSEQIYGPVTERQQTALNSIDASGRHLLALINDILDVAKIEAGNLALDREPVMVVDVCRASLQMLAQTALSRRIQLSITTDSAVEIIEADMRRLKQILVNLLSNAVKFTPEGGRVGLEVRGDSALRTATFTVWDTGIGIAAEDLPKLFQPFMQIDSSLSRQYEGTGLGLALVRRLAEAHGGSVTVASVFGQGSRFSVALPWAPSAPRALVPPPLAAAPPPDRPDPAAPAPLILLAEDNVMSSDMLQEYLEVHGYRVVVARDGAAAIAQAQATAPALILMDVQMPGMDGLEAMLHIRADRQLDMVPIIALTALAMPGDRERCLQAGANDYLAKPVSLRTLLTMIGALLQRRTTGE